MPQQNPFGSPEEISIGGFPFVKYGSLLGEEQEWFENQEKSQIDAAIPFLELAAEIAREKGVEGKDALQAVKSFGGDDDFAPLLLGHTDKLRALTESLAFERRLPRNVATMMIQSRISNAWLKEQASNLQQAFPRIQLPENWDGEWSYDLTTKLPEHITNQIVSFAMAERREWAQIEPSEEDEQEDLGKSSKPSTRSRKKA